MLSGFKLKKPNWLWIGSFLQGKSQWLLFIFGGVLVLGYILGVLWSVEPNSISKKALVVDDYKVGYATSTALIYTAETLLEKNGGFLSNDVSFPANIMDNMPAFEFGALEQVRDLALLMRKEFSRSQSQSVDDRDLVIAQPKFNIDHRSWIFPSAEGEYQDGINALKRYRSRIMDTQEKNAQFYARADNLAHYLEEVSNRLGSMSQRLSASVSQKRQRLELAGDAQALQSTSTESTVFVQTPWTKIDDVFYESRGTCWALLNFMTAVEVDFHKVLQKKNAAISLKQIIRELHATQDTVWSPMVLNGSGFGLVANHSLVMANYISRANAAVIDLISLLNQG